MTTLTTTGSGPSKEIAVQQSLRSAIEQAFGAFISAKTEILVDGRVYLSSDPAVICVRLFNNLK